MSRDGMPTNVVPTSTIDVPTSLGPGCLSYFTPKRAQARVVLGHGAGGGIHVRDLQAIAASLPDQGIEVVLVEQPWVLAGKKVAPNPARLDEGWTQLIAGLNEGPPVILGGRSAGARVAVRTATPSEAIAVVALSFPLHAPGRPEKTRADELLTSQLPTLVVQGTRDPFGSVDEIRAVVGKRKQYTVVSVADADHSFKVPAKSASSTSDALVVVTTAIADFVQALG